MVRITEVEKEKLTEMLERFSNDALIIVCAEGEPYDKDVRSHVHMYLECKHSESWLRKQFQNLDRSRKSNQLYSMKKSHENSVNYVLKNYFKENENRSRIWFQRNCAMDLFLTWKNMHEKYMAEVAVAKVARKKSQKSFSQIVTEEVVSRCSEPDTPASTEQIIKHIIQIYNDEQVKLPTRNQMESYVLNVRNKLGHSEYVINYYLPRYENNF